MRVVALILLLTCWGCAARKPVIAAKQPQPVIDCNSCIVVQEK